MFSRFGRLDLLLRALLNLKMTTSPIPKKMCLGTNGDNTARPKIGTHDGVFHCDESLGCYLIKQLPQYKNATIIRTRKQELLETCDIVLDVGALYNNENQQYDHHQKSFDLTLSSIYPTKTFGDVKLSSAGLVYAHYGHEIIASLLDWKIDDSKTDTVFDKVYENFIKEIDGIDNGVSMFDGKPRYLIHTHLSARISSLKPYWNEESNDEILYQRFLKAVELAGTEFQEVVIYYGRPWMEARVVVEQAFAKRFEIDPSGRILLLTTCAPWIQHLFIIEEENKAVGEIAFVLFPDKDSFRVRAVPTAPESFELRNPLHKSWLGFRQDELSTVTGIKGCIFVHSSGFIGGNSTLEGAIEMARKSLIA